MTVDIACAPEDLPATDSDLVTRAAAGCERSQSEIHRRYFHRLVVLCQEQVGDPHLAQDVAQTTVLRVLRFASSFEGQRSLWPWMRMIALRQCWSMGKRSRREITCAANGVFDREQPDHTEQVVDGMVLRAAMSELPPRQRMALTLRYLEDVDRDLAARIIGVNQNAFDQLLARGRLSLAAAYRSKLAVGALGLVLAIRHLGRRAPGAATPAAFLGASAAALASVAAVLSLQVAPPPAAVVPLQDSTGVATRTTTTAERTAQVTRPAQEAAAVPAPAGLSVSSGPARVHVAGDPLAPGTVESDALEVPTPLGAVHVQGSLEREPGEPLACAQGPGTALVARC